VWCSDLDGVFGTGGSFGATLSAGAHIVTVTATDSDGTPALQISSRLSRRALAMTETELKVMAALAMIGLSSSPKNG